MLTTLIYAPTVLPPQHNGREQMSKTRGKNPNWKRSTTADRRAKRVTRFIKVSKQYEAVVDPVTKAITGYMALPGNTYAIGRNASKRKDRQADIRARVASRKAA